MFNVYFIGVIVMCIGWRQAVTGRSRREQDIDVT